MNSKYLYGTYKVSDTDVITYIDDETGERVLFDLKALRDEGILWGDFPTIGVDGTLFYFDDMEFDPLGSDMEVNGKQVEFKNCTEFYSKGCTFTADELRLLKVI